MSNTVKLTTLSLLTALCLAPACDKGNDPAPEAEAAPAASGKAEAPPADAPAADPAVQAEADALLDADLASLDPKVQKAVTIAREIESDPGAADEILGKHELDREGLDALMYEIARSPELSKSYRDARMSS